MTDAIIAVRIFGVVFLALAVWRIVRIDSFIREDVLWLRKRFDANECDEGVARKFSYIVAGVFTLIGMAMVTT
jgi:hypothetical protein